MIGLLTLFEYTFGWDVGFDQWLFRESVGGVDTSHPGRMALDTALCFVLLAAAVWAACGGRRIRWVLPARVILGSLVATVGLVAILSHLMPGLGRFGWWDLTPMAVPTAVVFLVLGAAIVLDAWRRALDPGFSRFTRALSMSAGLVVLLSIAGVLYMRAEDQENRTEELRYRSFLLADELRQSSDDLTRMVRT